MGSQNEAFDITKRTYTDIHHRNQTDSNHKCVQMKLAPIMLHRYEWPNRGLSALL